MTNNIEKVIKNGDGNAIVMTALIAAAIANSLPTPFDAIYFQRQKKLKDDLESGKISPRNYWYHDVGEYYLWTTLWYVTLIGLVVIIKSDFKSNKKILIPVVSGGLVIGVMLKNIQKEEEVKELAKQQADALLQTKQK